MKTYNIVFMGESINDIEITVLKQNMARLFKSDSEKIEKLFSGKPVIIKKNLPADKAKAYQKALLKAGAKITIKEAKNHTQAEENSSTTQYQKPTEKITGTAPISSGLAGLLNYNQGTSEPSLADEDEPQNDQDGELKLLPPNSGSLDDYAIPSEPVEIPDISDITMAEPETGSLEEFAIEVEAVELPDISDLSMSEAQTGSLEEFAPKVVPVEVPDTSYMDITDMNERYLSDQSPRPKPVELPDISELSMSEAQSGSLEEFAIKQEPAELPDTSKLSIKSQF